MAIGNDYRMCTRCVMDTSDPDIQFDVNGVCNHCRESVRLRRALVPPPEEMEARLASVVHRITAHAKGREYDCLLGISGGVDSSYCAYLAKKLGLRPLVVHLDNGWNSETAVQNINYIVERLGFELFTHVINWEEFRDLQRAYFKASVIDIEVLTDQAIHGCLLNIAAERNIKYIISGGNVATESHLPRAWGYNKYDLVNLRAIHGRFGSLRLKTFPTCSIWRVILNTVTGRREFVRLLNNVPYSKQDAMRTMERELGWRYYGGKHYESTFTKFYQAYYLPRKFGIDKRRAHYSSLVANGEMTRDEALHELQQPLYADDDLRRDRQYVLKKLGFSDAEFETIMNTPPVAHTAYPSMEPVTRHLLWLRDHVYRPLRQGDERSLT